MTVPPSATGITRPAATCSLGFGMCGHMWYENGTMIPGEPTIDEFSPLKTVKNCPNLGPLCKRHDGPGNALCCYGSEGLAPGFGVDTTRKAPWRAPGTAPITSPCGIEGGNPCGCPAGNPGTGGCMPGGYGHGTDGRTYLGRSDAPVTQWTAGSIETVKFNLHNNHGGGYNYRLCKRPANPMDVTEECFQKMPLKFVGDVSKVDYRGIRPNLEIPAISTTNGTFPAGSMWRKNPIPFCVWLTKGPSTHCPLGAQFKPPVKGTPEGYGPFPDFDIADQIQVPEGIEGDYVLSWRWDTEEFYPGQVWTTCANVHISAGPAPPVPTFPPLPPSPAPTPAPPCVDKDIGCPALSCGLCGSNIGGCIATHCPAETYTHTSTSCNKSSSKDLPNQCNYHCHCKKAPTFV